jgi:hypothetical protein
VSKRSHRLHYVDLSPPPAGAHSTRPQPYTKADLIVLLVAAFGILMCLVDVILWRH